MAEVTFDRSAAQEILETFGWTINDSGYIVKAEKPNLAVEANDGNVITIDEFAGVVSKNGEPTPLRDDFVSLCNYVDEMMSQ